MAAARQQEAASEAPTEQHARDGVQFQTLEPYAFAGLTALVFTASSMSPTSSRRAAALAARCLATCTACRSLRARRLLSVRRDFSASFLRIFERKDA